MHRGTVGTRLQRPPEPVLHPLPGSVQRQQVLQDVFHSLREAVAGQVRRGVDLGLVSFPVFTCGGQTNSRRQRSGGLPPGSGPAETGPSSPVLTRTPSIPAS